MEVMVDVIVLVMRCDRCRKNGVGYLTSIDVQIVCLYMYTQLVLSGHTPLYPCAEPRRHRQPAASKVSDQYTAIE